MQKHIKVYREYFGIGDQDISFCENCHNVAVDIHHITSRGLKEFTYYGNTYDINDILNLIGLCRDCHNMAHSYELTKDYLYDIHQDYIIMHG